MSGQDLDRKYGEMNSQMFKNPIKILHYKGQTKDCSNHYLSPEDDHKIWNMNRA